MRNVELYNIGWLDERLGPSGKRTINRTNLVDNKEEREIMFWTIIIDSKITDFSKVDDNVKNCKYLDKIFFD